MAPLAPRRGCPADVGQLCHETVAFVSSPLRAIAFLPRHHWAPPLPGLFLPVVLGVQLAHWLPLAPHPLFLPVDRWFFFCLTRPPVARYSGLIENSLLPRFSTVGFYNGYSGLCVTGFELVPVPRYYA